MIERLDDLIARHPCPAGHTPVKSALGSLIDRYGVGGIPLEELHRANSICKADWERMRRRASIEAKRSAAETGRIARYDAMARDWEASHVG